MDRFDEVEALDTDALRRLLEMGTGRERIWAAWALGLRLGAAAQPELARASRREPDPGARRHLVVLLAGYRNLDLLAVLARHDPDGYVRASACQYLALVAPDAPEVRGLLKERLAEDTFSAVRSAIVQHLPVVAREDFAWVAGAAADEDLEVRSAALNALARVGARAAPVLRERARVEPDSLLRSNILQRWLDAEGALALLEDCVHLPVERAIEVLDLLALKAERFDWERLSPIAARGVPALDEALVQCLRPEGEPAEARMWLADLVLRGYTSRATLPARDAALRAVWRLSASLRPPRELMLEGEERERLGRVRELLEALCAPDPDEQDEDEEELYEYDEGWGPAPEDELLELLQQRMR